MTKILVTGGAGFIGSHVARYLLSEGNTVFILDDLSGGFIENLPSDAHFRKGSVTDHHMVDHLFQEEQFDYVFHFAAYAAEGLSHFIKRFNYMNNLIGSINLINAAINTNVKCFVFTSSIAVYGTSSELPMVETTVCHPEDSYGIAKLAVERELMISQKMFGLNHIIFRPHNVYGERQNIGDKYRNVIGIFMNQILQGKPMTIFGDGDQLRAFSYIGDIVPVIADSIHHDEAYNQIFNIGADTPYSINELASSVAHSMGIQPEIIHLPARNEVVAAYSSHEKVRKYFGERKLHSLNDGLQIMAEWVKQNGSCESKNFNDLEIKKNLPDFWIK